MSAQQIRFNINSLVNNIEDEKLLDVYYEMLVSLAKIAKRQTGTIAIAEEPSVQAISFNEARSEPIKEEDTEEKVIPHDLSLIFLANQIFKGSSPIPEEGAIAFKRALLKSSTTEPILL
jgi:hypothetical protein